MIKNTEPSLTMHLSRIKNKVDNLVYTTTSNSSNAHLTFIKYKYLFASIRVPCFHAGNQRFSTTKEKMKILKTWEEGKRVIFSATSITVYSDFCKQKRCSMLTLISGPNISHAFQCLFY